jgi:Glyoxalase-like domain
LWETATEKCATRSLDNLKIGSIVIECEKFEETMAFWIEALSYSPRNPPTEDWVVLKDRAGMSPNISLQKVPEKAPWNNRIHLDLYAQDGEREIERLLKLGATRHPQEYDPDDDFRVLEDPDGNLFCVVQLPK